MKNGEPVSFLPGVARGDRHSLEQLYDHYSPVLYGLPLRILRDPEDAQEVLQETFIQIWRRASMFDPSRGSEISWLVSIARSRAIDKLRSRNARDQRESEAGREISIHDSSVHKVSAAEDLLRGERQQVVRAALRELPENQKVALELAYFEGLSQSEIALKLGEPLGTIKTRMQLGMKKLRERLREFST